VKLHSIAVFLVIVEAMAGMTKPSMAVPVDGENARSTEIIVQEKSSMADLPVNPKEMLVRIKRALQQELFLSEDFYTDDNLKIFFGKGYTFRPNNSSSRQKEIHFDDLGNIYVGDNGDLTVLGKNRPCFQGGAIILNIGADGHIASAGLAFATAARITSHSSFYSDLVVQEFGVPSSVTEGSPTAPPLHGRAYIQEQKTHDLGNSWLNYKEESEHSLKRMAFRTLGDAAIVEIQIFVSKK